MNNNMYEKLVKFDSEAFKEQPMGYTVNALGFEDPVDALEEIISEALPQIKWIDKAEVPYDGDDFISREYTPEEIARALSSNKAVTIVDTDERYHTVRWMDFADTFYAIAVDPENWWIIEDLIGKKKGSSKRRLAADLFVQMMTLKNPEDPSNRHYEYFG